MPSCARAPASNCAGRPFAGMPDADERAAAAQAGKALVDRACGAGGDDDASRPRRRPSRRGRARPCRAPMRRRSRSRRAERRPRAWPARRRRRSLGRAPARAAPWTAFRPTPPAPITTTVSPGRTRASRATAPIPVMTAQAIRQALVSGTPSGIATACDACTTTSSANAPQRSPWTARSPPASTIGEAIVEPEAGVAERGRALPAAGAAPAAAHEADDDAVAGAGVVDARPRLDDDAAASCPNTAGSAPPQSPLA